MRRSRPLWRRAIAVAGTAFRLVVLGGLRSWRRDLRVSFPALGSIALLLTLGGILGLGGVAMARVAADQAATASTIDVYIAPDADPAGVTALRERLAADSRVASVVDVPPDQALARARSRPGLGDLADLAGSNPFSEVLEVRVRQLTAVGAVAAVAAADPAADRDQPTSYDPQAYAGLRELALGVGVAGGGLLLLLTFIAYAVCANAIRAVALARRDEMALARMLAARNWMIRGPFVVEGVATGAFAAVAAAAAVGAGWWLTERASARVYAEFLPGVGLRSVELDVAAILLAGMLIGGLAAAFGARRLTP